MLPTQASHLVRARAYFPHERLTLLGDGDFREVVDVISGRTTSLSTSAGTFHRSLSSRSCGQISMSFRRHWYCARRCGRPFWPHGLAVRSVAHMLRQAVCAQVRTLFDRPPTRILADVEPAGGVGTPPSTPGHFPTAPGERCTPPPDSTGSFLASARRTGDPANGFVCNFAHTATRGDVSASHCPHRSRTTSPAVTCCMGCNTGRRPVPVGRTCYGHRHEAVAARGGGDADCAAPDRGCTRSKSAIQRS